MREHQDKLLKLRSPDRICREDHGRGVLPDSSSEGFATETQLFSGLGLSGDLLDLGKRVLDGVYLRLKGEEAGVIELNQAKRTELVEKMGDLLGDQNKAWKVHFELRKTMRSLVGQYEESRTLESRKYLAFQVGLEIKRLKAGIEFEELMQTQAVGF